MTNRQPPTGLSKANVERLLKLDSDKTKARRAERSKAAAEAKAAKQAQKDAEAVAAAQAEAAHKKDRHAVNLAALEAEMAATGMSREDAAASMGVDPATGALAVEEKKGLPYSGPMVVLKTARLNYTKAANGILCNGDKLAVLCGAYERPIVVAALIAALDLPGNPYLALNPGQQSMNLRNKARHAVNEGRLSHAKVEACLKAAAAAAAPKATTVAE